MILKYLTHIARARPIVLTALVLPVIPAIFFSNYKFNIMPESPYLEYTITIDVPGMAAEVERKVTVVAEKVMNGLPSLLVLESSTTHEKSVVNLKFKAKTKEATFLFIQEKIDRLKIMLPSEASV